MAFIKEKVLENNRKLFESFNLTYDGKKEMLMNPLIGTLTQNEKYILYG